MTPRSFPPHRQSRRRGVALILVLGTLVFISVLIVAFFGSVSHELASSKSYASGVSSRIYADAAVNLVIGQLQAGTTQDDATRTWTSQPGLIRRFTNQGRQENVFKLYSSNKMVEDANFSPTNASGAPTDVPDWTAGTDASSLPWNLHPNLYTDLNSPLVVTSGSTTSAKYPILNPAGLAATVKIDGFDVDSTRALSNSLEITKTQSPGAIDQIPMPVRWIYILTDGRIAIADANAADATSVTLTTTDGQPVAADNPPVARVAFWTDDNTCRLNVNTASEGDYWTVPVAPAADDVLARNQVYPREYQRYPGHPASTSLSPVMNFVASSSTSALTTGSAVNSTDLRNFIFAMAPRIGGRGSQFGSHLMGYSYPVQPDNDRLYASVDELLFLPDLNTSDSKRYAANTVNVKARKSNELDWVYTQTYVPKSKTGNAYVFASPGFSYDPKPLDEARFFLTANSRAPEVSLFGKPRMSLWPIDTRSDYRSVYDRLLAFSSTVSGNPFYFQRQNPDSQTDDYDSIQRNKELLSFLDRLAGTNVPGFGGNFSSKYSAADCQQLEAAIFDWIRTVNLAYRDKGGAVKPYAWTSNPSPVGTQPPATPGSGQVLPIKIGTTRGYGRFPVLSKAAIAINRENESTAGGTTTITYRATFLMETYVPALGYAAYVPNYHIRVSGLSNAFEVVTGTSAATATSATPYVLDFQDGDILVTSPANFETYTGRAWGGTQGFNNLFTYSNSGANYALAPRTLGGTDPASGYPFVSSTFSVAYPSTVKDAIYVGLRPKGAASGTNNVSIALYDASNATAISSYTVPIPSFGPLKGATLSATSATAITGTTVATATAMADRVAQMASMANLTSGAQVDWAICKNVIHINDLIKGVELGHGDLRLLAIHGTDTNNPFVKHKYYDNASKPQAHSLLLAAGSAYGLYGADTLGTDRGTLAAGSATAFNKSTHAESYIPQAPSALSSATSALSAASDFSNGISSESDGPHILKADEGNTSFGGMSGWGMSEAYPYQNQLCPYDDLLSDSFSPNREVSSAVQLGTLPSQAASSIPWQTLLFRPPELSGTQIQTHPGAQSPPDHLLLDLFWMPVIDPYPISEALSTSGKVNMNYQIAPFTYINRATALLGALKATKVEAIAQDYNTATKVNGAEYKNIGYAAPTKVPYISSIYPVDTAQTLLFFKERFAKSDPSQNIFKSASEICSIPLAPTQGSYTFIGTGHAANQPANPLHSVDIAGAADANALRSEIKKFWTYNTLTGDNTLEAPYNALYPRLTTQSNTYTVYVRAQALQVGGPSSGGKFTNIQKRVTGEYRGAYEIERYIDINDASIPDLASPGNDAKTIYRYYKFRILSAKQFVP